MKLKENIRWFVFAALITSLLMPHVAVAEMKEDFSPAHLAAAERLVFAMGMYESLTIPTTRALEQMRATDPARAELIAHVAEPFIKKEYIGQEFRQFMAAHFDLKTCEQLTEYWEGPVGRKYVAVQVQLLTTGKAPPLTFTPVEESMLKLFEKTRACAEFSRAWPALEARVAAFSNEIGTKIAQRMREESVRSKEREQTDTMGPGKE